MNLYLDDDMASRLLARLLVQAGHDVLIPESCGFSGASDPTHFICAIQRGRAMVTGNQRDFGDLHDLVLESGGHHWGVLVIRKDNDARRDMLPKAIVRSIGKVQAAIDVRDQFVILNHWR